MLKVILLGTLLVGATVVIHAVGTTSWIRLLRRWRLRRDAPPSMTATCAMLSATASYLLLLHVAEVMLWAVTYVALGQPVMQEPSGQPPTLEDAVYFSIVTSTSLGYGDVVIRESPLRILAGIEAVNGLLLFGWSTALLIAIVQRILFAEMRDSADERRAEP